MSGSIVVATDSITFESVEPTRLEVLQTMEGYAYDKLDELGVDMSGADLTKFVNEGENVFAEIRTKGIKFVVRLLEKDHDPDTNYAVWMFQIEQH